MGASNPGFRNLHQIKKVMLIDHRDCGAYKVILGEDFAKEPARETQVHAENLARLAADIRAARPDLETETRLMNLDGTVETLSS